MPLDRQINELEEQTTLADDLLVIIGSPVNGRLFKTTLGKLKLFLGVGPSAQLSRPTVTVTNITSTTVSLSLSGDSRTQSFVIRLATDAQFTTGVRNATVNAPANTYQFTALTPGTTYYLEVKATAIGLTTSDAATGATATNSNVVLGFPYSFPVNI